MKYRKKPVVIEAIQYSGIPTEVDNDSIVPAWAIEARMNGVLYFDGTELMIETLEGPMHVSQGDYIIKGVAGELYACKPDIFKQTYESAEEMYSITNPLPALLGDLAPTVESLANRGIRIIIDGDRSKPTGKSTLCDYLKTFGADVYEAWELEEGEKKLDHALNCNSVEVRIQMNKPLVFDDGLFTNAASDGVISRKAEFEYLKSFARESDFDTELNQAQLRSLWTAYCFHHELTVDTSEYDDELQILWRSVYPACRWCGDFDSFDAFMCKYLV